MHINQSYSLIICIGCYVGTTVAVERKTAGGRHVISASEMTYIVSSGALNSTHSLTQALYTYVDTLLTV